MTKLGEAGEGGHFSLTPCRGPLSEAEGHFSGGARRDRDVLEPGVLRLGLGFERGLGLERQLDDFPRGGIDSFDYEQSRHATRYRAMDAGVVNSVPESSPHARYCVHAWLKILSAMSPCLTWRSLPVFPERRLCPACGAVPVRSLLGSSAGLGRSCGREQRRHPGRL